LLEEQGSRQVGALRINPRLNLYKYVQIKWFHVVGGVLGQRNWDWEQGEESEQRLEKQAEDRRGQMND
jgi:hypothetical protein